MSYIPKSSSDPIRVYHESSPGLIEAGYSFPGWYFWDETWSELHGPFSTLEECREALNYYAGLL